MGDGSGGDRINLFEPMLDRQLRFLFRLVGNRHLVYNGKARLASEVAAGSGMPVHRHSHVPGPLGARRQIGLRLRTRAAAQLLRTVFGIRDDVPGGVPQGNTLDDLFAALSCDAVQEKLTRFTEILIDRKVLYPWRLLDAYYVAAIDATGTLTFADRHCPYCLTRTLHGQTVYYHNVLQASMVTPVGLVFPLLPEFIENPSENPNATDEKKKQDCELKAFYRLADRMARRFPRLALALVMDGLYAVGPVFARCRKYGWRLLISLSDDQLTSVNEECHALVKSEPANILERDIGKHGDIHQLLRWAHAIEYHDTARRVHTLDVFECRETKPENDSPTTFRWVTNFQVSAENASTLANNGGRLRWKTKNETFNVQRNGGFELEHAYTTNENATKIFHLLLQFAHVVGQLVQKGSLFRNAFPKGFGSAKDLATEIIEAVRRICLTAESYARILTERIQIRFESRPPLTALAGRIHVPPLDSS